MGGARAHPGGGAGRAPAWLVRQAVAVALAVLVALAIAGLLRFQVAGATTTFADRDAPLRLAYPANWGAAEPVPGTLLRVEDPRADSTFKTTLTVESRDIDPAAPPTLQALVDRRVAQQGGLTAYALLSNDEAAVDGTRGARIEYAYVAQPVAGPGRRAVPVVVRAREYLVVAADRAYYITLAVPEGEARAAFARFDRIIAEAKIR